MTYTVTRSAGRVVISAKSWHRLDIARVLAAPLLLVPCAYAQRFELGGWGELLLALGVGVLAFTLWRLASIHERIVVAIGDQELEVRRRWRAVQVARVQIAAFLVRERAGATFFNEGYELVALLGDGSPRLLARSYDARLAFELASELRRELGVAEAPVSGALDRAPVDGAVPWVQIGLSFLVVGLVIWLAIAVGTSMAALDVGDAPASVTFSVSEPMRIELRSQVDYDDFMPQPLAAAFVYDVVIEAPGGAPVAKLECDPFAARTHLWSEGGKKSVTSFFVALPGCAVNLAGAGTFSVRAFRRWRMDPHSAKVARTRLFVHVAPRTPSST